MKKIIILFFSLVCFSNLLFAQLKYANDVIKTGAEQTELYISKLQGKRVGLIANQTSIIGKIHLADSLINRGVNIVKIFGPEHGFRGNASNGTEVHDETDPGTGIKVISLYGKRRNQQKKILRTLIFLFTIFRMLAAVFIPILMFYGILWNPQHAMIKSS